MNRSCILGLVLLAAPAFAEDPAPPPAAAASAASATNAATNADAAAKTDKTAKEQQSTTVIDAENRELKPHDVLGFLIEQDPSVVEAQRGNGGGSNGDAETVFVTDAGEAMFRVTRSSPISVKLSVAGKKLEVVRKELKVLLDAEYYHDCSFRLDLQAVNRSSAMLDSSSSAKVVLYGSGGLSGTFPVIEGKKLMLSDVIISAGGKSGNDFANLRKVKVRRFDPATKKESVSTIDVKKIIENGDRNADVELKDGDRVEVPARPIIF